ncbi:LAETG motif-containing sortase-dependent surface protein [Streptomyces sp. NBC_01235]|uniref:LAETG motif-containing sortase-dependent surface protein n=1 Tax=Streptomyces sp. NBC_01235 TaxID=2903788 RepID=UPI002E14A63C|nr:LPXTG cell wall anchor domain-containing protein [Streptomyces sp. NBC_01235]
MSLSRRTAARSVRMLGVTAASAALALSAAGTALANDIKDFSAEAACDGTQGVITVTDKNAAGTPAIVTVFLENNGADLRQVGKPQNVKGTAAGVTVSFAEAWEPNVTYRVHIKAGNDVNADVEPFLTTPAKACKADDTSTPSTTPSSTESSTPSDTAPPPVETVTPSPSDSASDSAAPVPSASNVPSAAVQESNLAETGANSNTGLIVGIAAALVVVGGGAVFFGMRRRGSSNR